MELGFRTFYKKGFAEEKIFDLHSVWEGGKEWNGMEKKEYFKNMLSFPMFGSLNMTE